MALYCKKCGAPLKNGAKFCGKCGTPVPSPSPAVRPPVQTGMVCPSCGYPLKPDAKFCGKCGAPVKAAVQPVPAQVRPAEQKPQPVPVQPRTQPAAVQPAGFSVKKDMVRGDLTAKFNPNDIQHNKGMAVLAYFGPLVLIPIFAARKSPYARFHANQALNLLTGYFMLWGYNRMVTNLLDILFDGLGSALSIVFYVITVTIGIFGIMGIVHAASGTAKELPWWGRKRLLRPVKPQ